MKNLSLSCSLLSVWAGNVSNQSIWLNAFIFSPSIDASSRNVRVRLFKSTRSSRRVDAFDRNFVRTTSSRIGSMEKRRFDELKRWNCWFSVPNNSKISCKNWLERNGHWPVKPIGSICVLVTNWTSIFNISYDNVELNSNDSHKPNGISVNWKKNSTLLFLLGRNSFHWRDPSESISRRNVWHVKELVRAIESIPSLDIDFGRSERDLFVQWVQWCFSKTFEKKKTFPPEETLPVTGWNEKPMWTNGWNDENQMFSHSLSRIWERHGSKWENNEQLKLLMNFVMEFDMLIIANRSDKHSMIDRFSPHHPRENIGRQKWHDVVDEMHQTCSTADDPLRSKSFLADHDTFLPRCHFDYVDPEARIMANTISMIDRSAEQIRKEEDFFFLWWTLSLLLSQLIFDKNRSVSDEISLRSQLNCSSIVLDDPSVFLLFHLVDLSDGHGETFRCRRCFSRIDRVLRRILFFCIWSSNHWRKILRWSSTRFIVTPSARRRFEWSFRTIFEAHDLMTKMIDWDSWWSNGEE